MTAPRILIVEDEGIIALMLQRLLTKLGYEVTAMVSSGESAIQSAAEQPPDLVLMDIRLAGTLDGIETAARIRARRDVPVIYLSAYAEEIVMAEVQHTQPYGFLSKPIRDQELAFAVEMALYKHQMEMRLRQNETKYRRLVTMLQEGVWVIDSEAQTTFVNPRMAKMLGYTVEEMTGKSLLAFVAQSDVGLAKKLLARRQEGVIEQHEFRFLHKTGQTITTLIETAPILDGAGEYDGAVAGIIDITERKQREIRLQASELLLSKAEAMARLGSWAWDMEEDTFSVSEEWRRIHGLNTALLSREHLLPIAHPDDRERIKVAMERALTYGEPYDIEHRIIRQDTGDVRIVQAYGEVVCDGERPVKMYGVAQDITKRKEVEQALRQSEASLRALIDNTEDLIAARDQAFRVTLYNQAFADIVPKLFGVEAEPGLRTIDYLPEEDRKHWEAIIARVLKGQRYREVFQFEIDGEPRYYNLAFNPIRREDGEVIGIAEFNHDITEYKRIEVALRHSTERLQILREIDAAILTAQSPQEIARGALEHLRDLIPYDRASIAEIDLDKEQARDLIVLDERDAGAKTPAWHPLSGAGAALDVLQTGEVYAVEDLNAVATLSAVEQMLSAHDLRAYVSVPLMDQGRLLGSLNVASSTPNFFHPDHVEILKEIATSLSIAIRQANLLAQTQQDAETKALLLQDVNHRVMNNLDMILSILNLEMDQSANHRARDHKQGTDTLQAVLQDVYNRIQGIATVHRLLSESQQDLIDPGMVVGKVIRAALNSSPIQNEIVLELDMPPEVPPVPSKQAVALALIVNELTTNSIKYAFADRTDGEIRVQMVRMPKEEGGQALRIVFRDDGPGLPEEVLARQAHNVGLWLIRASVTRTLGGEISWYNDGGAVVDLQFPLQMDGHDR
jgi:PAS domain S-box-containing protein